MGNLRWQMGLRRWAATVLAGSCLAGSIFAARPAFADGSPSGWSPAASMGTARTEGATATTLTNGEVLVAGGRDSAGAFLTSAELYNPASNTWTPTGSMSEDRGVGTTATLLQDGRVLVVGGQCGECGGSSTPTAEIYSPSTGTWSPAASMAVGRYNHTATLLRDGRVLVAGGYGALGGGFGGQVWATAELYDPATNTWASAGSMSNERYLAAATRLSNGRVLVSGGQCDASGACTTASADIYNPKTNSWTPTSQMLLARFGHEQFLLPDGDVMAIGGSSPSLGATSEVEIYNHFLGTWSLGPSTLTSTYGVVGGVLSDGRILLAGGYQGPDPNFSQQYLPNLNAWVAAGDTETQRTEPIGVPFGDGEFLLAGGYTGCFPNCTLASAEIFGR